MPRHTKSNPNPQEQKRAAKRERDWTHAERIARKGLRQFNADDVERAKKRGLLIQAAQRLTSSEAPTSEQDLASFAAHRPITKLPSRSAKGLNTPEERKRAWLRAKIRARRKRR